MNKEHGADVPEHRMDRYEEQRDILCGSCFEKREGVKMMCEILEKERAQGVTIGEDYFAMLTGKLLHDARIEELQKATKDKGFRENLYREYGITK